MTCERSRPSPFRFAAGVAVVLLGALLFLREIHVAGVERLLDWFFPAVFLGLGIALLLQPECRGRNFWGWVFVVFGGILTAARLGAPLPGDVWDYFWPAILIIGGIQIVRQSLRASSDRRSAGDLAGEPAGSRVLHTSVFAGQEIRSTSERFSGGSLTAIWGACTLDLTGAKTAPEGAVLDIFALWGGIKVHVPEGWEVHSDVVPVLAGFDDQTRRIPGTPATGLITIRGTAIMAGVEIAN